MKELAEVAVAAAYTLDRWSLHEDSSSNDVLQLARRLEGICSESMNGILTASRAYQDWKPNDLVLDVATLASEINIVRNRLLQAAKTKNMGWVEESASLRDFCVKLSRHAL